MIACHRLRLVNASFNAHSQLQRLGKSLCTSSSYRKQDTRKDVYDAIIVGAGKSVMVGAGKSVIAEAGKSVVFFFL